MQLTVDIPDEMVPRLRPHENRLTRILELGLEAMEASRPQPDDTASDPEGESWRRAALDFAGRAADEGAEEPLTPEEILAYAEETLDETERAELEERLALDPEAVDELLDYHRFEGLEPPSRDLALSDDDVRAALGELRGKIAENNLESEMPTATEPNGPRPASFSRKLQRQLPYLALAASLILALGSLLSLQSGQDTVIAQPVQPLALERERGGGSLFRPNSDIRWLELKLPRIALKQGEEGEIILLARSGRQVLRTSIIGPSEGSPGLSLSPLSSKDLPPGKYRIEILDTDGDVIDRLEFSIE